MFLLIQNCLDFLAFCEGNESEASIFAGIFVDGEADVGNLAELLEVFLNFLAGGFITQTLDY